MPQELEDGRRMWSTKELLETSDEEMLIDTRRSQQKAILSGRYEGVSWSLYFDNKHHPKVAIPAALRWEVWERDDFTCRACGARRFLTIDHIISEWNGGLTEAFNLQTLCRACNRSKGRQ